MICKNQKSDLILAAVSAFSSLEIGVNYYIWRILIASYIRNVAVTQLGPNGAEENVGTLGHSDFFGEIALLYDR